MLLEGLTPFLGSFRGQVVVVTGASSGIGKATALAFGRGGANVALLARRRELLDEVANTIRSAGGKALALPVDVGDPRAVRNAVARIRRSWHRIDVLVNNAGVLIPARIDEMNVADLHAMMNVNLFGAVHAIQAVLPGMKRRRRGAIVNVASLAGRRGFTPLGGYCATKFALVGLNEALRAEVHDANIHVGVVLPGAVDTPMVHDVDQVATLPEWPAAFNMPPDWVVAAVLLSVRFRLHEVSVPPGAATLEIIGSLAPGAADAMIGWMAAAGRLLSRAGSLVGNPSPRATPKRKARTRGASAAARRRR